MPRILIQNQKKLSKEEKENRCQYIAGLFRKGWSKLTITEHISNEWGISKQSAANWIKQTYKYINSHDESFVKNLRRIQLERLELMLMEAMEARKSELDNLVKLYCSGYFSAPSGTKKSDITEQASKNVRKNLNKDKE